MIYFARGSLHDNLTPADLEQGLIEAFGRLGTRRRVVLVPPDITRLHSRAGDMACCAWRYYGVRISDVLPALGTHSPMTPAQIDRMYPGIPHDRFRVHDWRTGVETLGRVPADYVREVSEGAVDYDWPAQIDRLLLEDGMTAPAKVSLLPEREPGERARGLTRAAITIHEGRNRQVRRMFAAVGCDVKSLKRVRFAGLTLKGVARGQHRALTEEEVSSLYRLAGCTR